VKEIERQAFGSCGLKSIRIPNSVEEIGLGCFQNCEFLSDFMFESISELREIGDGAFAWSKVEMIEIPAKCEKLSGLSLIGLKSVSFCEGNQKFILEGDFLTNNDGNTLIRYFGHNSRVSIKNHIEKIADGCFSSYKFLCEVTFESISNVKELGRSAFFSCGLRRIRIPNSVEKIGEDCFRHCKSLCEVTFEPISKVKEIERQAFFSCGLKSVRIPNSVEKLGCRCFWSCESLYHVAFDSGSKLKEMGEDCFTNCPLKFVTVTEGVSANYKWPEKCYVDYKEWTILRRCLHNDNFYRLCLIILTLFGVIAKIFLHRMK
jgi:hypothetical protein